MSSTTRVSTRGIAWRWCAYEFADEFVLLYGVYTLLFIDNGVTTTQIASLFVAWSAVAVISEVPSGVIADMVPRRLLIGLAPLLRVTGFALWIVAPSYPAFLAGFVLWGLSGALQSGATESLVYEELRHRDAAGQYAAVAGRARACKGIAILMATLAAAPVFTWGGYAVIGAASIATGLLTMAIGLSFPERRDGAKNATSWREYLATLRAGMRLTLRHRTVRARVALVAGCTAIWGSLEEFIPLLAKESGASHSTVPLLIATVSAGTALGGLCAGRVAGISWRALASWVGTGGVLLIAALQAGLPGFAVIAVAFGVFNMSSVLSEARLQDAITGPARATVTSFAGLGAEAVAIAIYAGYALTAPSLGDAGAFSLGALGYIAIAIVVMTQSRKIRGVT